MTSAMVCWQVAKGDEVPLEDCKELIAEIDCDGDGVIDFRVRLHSDYLVFNDVGRTHLQMGVDKAS